MLRLVSINIERDKHLGLVAAFLESVRPDVVCMQELLEDDIPRFEAVVGPCFFVPSTLLEALRGHAIEGIGVFSRFPMRDREARQYYGREGELSLQVHDSTAEEKVKARRYVAALVTVGQSEVFRIVTTHFPWASTGGVNDHQRAALKNLFLALEPEADCIVCGDFNAPRGGEIFSALAKHWHDNIPDKYHTSLDITLHRAGKIDGGRLAALMVDGLFTTPEYTASNVSLVPGVSDHCAIVADIARTEGSVRAQELIAARQISA